LNFFMSYEYFCDILRLAAWSRSIESLCFLTSAAFFSQRFQTSIEAFILGFLGIFFFLGISLLLSKHERQRG